MSAEIPAEITPEAAGLNRIRNPFIRESSRIGSSFVASLGRDWAVNGAAITFGSIASYDYAKLSHYLDSEATPYILAGAALLSYAPYARTLFAEWRQQADLLVQTGTCDNFVSTSIFATLHPIAQKHFPGDKTTKTVATISATSGGTYDFVKGEAQTLGPLAGIIIGVNEYDKVTDLFNTGELMRYFTEGHFIEAMKNQENAQLFFSSIVGANAAATAVIRLKMLGLDFLFLRKKDKHSEERE